MNLSELPDKVVSAVMWVPRWLYRRVVIEEQAKAKRAHEDRAALLELRDALGESIAVEHIHYGADARLPAAEKATARARVLVASVPAPVGVAVVAYCDAFDHYRSKWSSAKPEDWQRRHDAFTTAIERLGEALAGKS
jgi:hypothetical protein